VSPGNAAAIIAGNPAADLYPQPPTDAVTTPQAQLVATLLDVEHRMQYLNNILARTAADLAQAERQPDPVPYLIMSLISPAPGPAGPAGALDTPSGRVLALSAALDSGRAELARRQQDAQALQQAIATAVQPTIAAAPAASTAAVGYLGGALPWPINGRITSGFGNRFDPYYHVWQLHPGLDIAAPIGTPIMAVAAGRVTQAGWFGGYGNYTCIDHGKVNGVRLSTCYGHQSRIQVTPGQVVRAGQVIGAVGSTGASTGPHLHFEVRLGGRPVNPLPWLRAGR
jgi:murein DD-endopeptidase MepM/ murein hydrolase activator NlpD